MALVDSFYLGTWTLRIPSTTEAAFLLGCQRFLYTGVCNRDVQKKKMPLSLLVVNGNPQAWKSKSIRTVRDMNSTLPGTYYTP